MTNLAIFTDRNWNTVAEDMITEALWPTLSTPTDVFPTNIFEADSRFRGTLVFGGQTSTSELPLICYRCTSIGNPVPFACQVMTTPLTVTIKIAFSGPEDIDESTAKATVTGMGYWSQVVECISRQPYNATHTAGPFGYANTTVIRGRGTGGTLYHVFPITISNPVTINSLNESEDLNRMSADVWTITGDVFLNVISN